jgi:hypothetical protein
MPQCMQLDAATYAVAEEHLREPDLGLQIFGNGGSCKGCGSNSNRQAADKIEGLTVSFDVVNSPGFFQVDLRNYHKAKIPEFYYILLHITKSTTGTPNPALRPPFAFKIKLCRSSRLAVAVHLREGLKPSKVGKKGERTSESIDEDYSNGNAIRKLENYELGLVFAEGTLRPLNIRNEFAN